LSLLKNLGLSNKGNNDFEAVEAFQKSRQERFSVKKAPVHEGEEEH
jgi:hypothetical protein